MTASKPEVVAYMWEHRGRHACVDRAYAEQLMDDGEQVAPLIRLADHERLQAEAERLQADHEAAIAELQADRDQQYDMKVKAREQRDVVTAENQRLRKALTRHVCTGMTDAQRTAELERYLSDGIAADKARIAELTEALKNAREMVADWGAYASEYFREKHGLDRDIAELDAALAQQGKEGEA